ncbi:MAG: hypothetical protein ACOVNU_14770 [Candidatus Kapaibacteriota bacterium]|jgi:hypothetical protein
MTLVKLPKRDYQELKIKEINNMKNMNLKPLFTNNIKSQKMNILYKFRILVVLIVVFCGLSNSTNAQTDSTNNVKKQKAEPMDLPNAIIYGDAYLNVGSSVKQNPNGTPKLDSKELDSLNSLEKQSALLLPVVGLSKDIYDRYEKKGYLNFDFGRFITPDLKAGYEMQAGNYTLFLNSGFNYSDGHTESADFTKLFLDIKSDYLAPKKFWLFGGSKTRTNLFYKSDDYSNYAFEKNKIENSLITLEQRKRQNFGFSVDVDGNYDGFDFRTGAGFNLASIKSDTTDLSEQGIRAYLKFSNPLNEYRLGFNFDLNLNNVNNQSTNLIQTNVFGGYQVENFDILFEGGIQLAKGSFSDSELALFLKASSNLKQNDNLSVNASIESGLENNNFTNLMYLNPYLSNGSFLNYKQNVVKINAGLWLHPNMNLGARVNVNYSKFNNFAVFVEDSSLIYNKINNNFNISYQSGSLFNINFDFYYNLTENDKIGTKLDVNYSILDTIDLVIPYIAPIDIKVNYSKNWTNDLRSNLIFNYIGQRNTSLDENKTIDAYLLINLHNEYKLKENLFITFNINNILNSKIYIWNGFIERGLFFNFGVNWQF